MSYSGLKDVMRHNRAVFEMHSEKRMNQMLREGNKEKLKGLLACGESCKTCGHRQKKQLSLFCKLKNKVVQNYNICEKHLGAPTPSPAV